MRRDVPLRPESLLTASSRTQRKGLRIRTVFSPLSLAHPPTFASSGPSRRGTVRREIDEQEAFPAASESLASWRQVEDKQIVTRKRDEGPS
jgi:hypothetical protein